MSTVFPTRHRFFVSPATLCAAYVYQDAYCKILTPQYVLIHMSLKFFPHFSHPPYGIEVTLVRLQYLHMSASRECIDNVAPSYGTLVQTVLLALHTTMTAAIVPQGSGDPCGSTVFNIEP